MHSAGRRKLALTIGGRISDRVRRFPPFIMNEDPVLARLKAKYAAMPPLFPQGDYLNIEENKSVFFVLREQYTTKGVWVQKQGVPESKIFRIRGPRKYAMNILVRGEQNRCVFLAPRTVAEVIISP